MGGCGRMGSDDDFPIRQVLPIGTRFCCWTRWASVFSAKKMYYNRYSKFSYIHLVLCGFRGGEMVNSG